MPQMSPMNWLSLSMICYSTINLMNLSMKESTHKKLKTQWEENKKTMKKWTW